LARTPSARHLPLHADFVFLGQRGRRLVCQAHPATPQAWRLHLDRRASDCHQPLHRRGQPQAQAVGLEPIHRRHLAAVLHVRQALEAIHQLLSGAKCGEPGGAGQRPNEIQPTNQPRRALLERERPEEPPRFSAEPGLRANWQREPLRRKVAREDLTPRRQTSTAAFAIKVFFNQYASRMRFHSAGSRQCAHAL